MVCYLCMNCTLEDLTTCRNIRCPAYFHRSCWKKYLRVNNIQVSKCQVCMAGAIKIRNPQQHPNGEVKSCGDCDSFRSFFKTLLGIH